MDYSQLRELDKYHALAAIDIKEYKIIESLVLCLIDVIKCCMLGIQWPTSVL